MVFQVDDLPNPDRFGFTVWIKRGDALAKGDGGPGDEVCDPVFSVRVGKKIDNHTHEVFRTTFTATQGQKVDGGTHAVTWA